MRPNTWLRGLLRKVGFEVPEKNDCGVEDCEHCNSPEVHAARGRWTYRDLQVAEVKVVQVHNSEGNFLRMTLEIHPKAWQESYDRSRLGL